MNYFPLEQVIDRYPLVVTPEAQLIEVIELMSQDKENSYLSLGKTNSDESLLAPTNQDCVLIISRDAQLCGIFTERDVVQLIATGRTIEGINIAEVMKKQVITLTMKASQDVSTALNLLRQHQIRHLPIVDEDNQLLGLVRQEAILPLLEAEFEIRTAKLEEQARREQALHHVIQSIRNSLDLSTIFETASLEITQLLAIDRTEIVQYLPEQGVWRNILDYCRDSQLKNTLGMEIPDQGNEIAARLKRREIVRVDNTSNLEDEVNRELGDAFPGAWLLVPLEIGSSVWGSLTLGRELPASSWKDSEVSLAQAVAEQLAIAIHQSQLYQQAQVEIKECRRTEEILKQQEQKFRSIFNSALDAILIADDQGRYIDANPAACKLFGISKEELLTASIADFADSNLDFAQTWQQFQQQGQLLGEFQIHLPDGTVKDVEFAATADFLPQQHLSILRNITERKQAEVSLSFANITLEQRAAELAVANEELQVTEEEMRQQNEELIDLHQLTATQHQRYQDLFNFAPDGYLVTNAQGKIQEANQAIAALLGYQKPAFLVGKPFAIVISEQERHAFYTQLNQLTAEGEPLEQVQSWEFTLKSRSCEPFPAAITVAVVHNPQQQIVGLRWLIRDITERKQKEEKIRQQAALLDVATDGILVRDLQNKILFWNKGAEHIYGWQAEEALGKDSFELLFKEIADQLEEAQETVREKGKWRGELRNITKSGKEIIVESRWTLVQNQAGQPISILTVDTDITEKKQLEAQLLRTQRLESIGTLASGIAHDLNNILTPIMMGVKLLPFKLPDLDDTTQQILKLMEDNAQRGGHIVKQVLSFARGVEGEKKPLQIKHLLQEISNFAQQTFPKSIEITKSIGKELTTVEGDATQLYQVLLNLCVNARDAMPNGGTLSISTRNIFLDENYVRMNLEAKVGTYVVITVADTGTGIAPEIKERIFDPFFTTKDVGLGTGLGLSTVIGIVKNHGGFVQVDSEVGKGTQVKVYLPAAEEAELQHTEDQVLPTGQGELILVVDDEIPILEITKITLENQNYQVITARDGIEALILYTQHREQISLVLMDLIMPSMDGLTAIRTLQKINPEVKVVAISGVTSKRQIAIATEMGVKACLTKPFTASELLETVVI